MRPPVASLIKKRLGIPLAALAALSGLGAVRHSHAAASTAHNDESVSYVLFASGSPSSSMSGSGDDLRRARSLRSGLEGLLYVHAQGARYVIRDPRTLSRARSILEPQEVIGRRQAELGARQAALGERQAALGQRQARLGEEQTRLGLRQARAGSDRREELDARQAALGEQQAALGRQQAALGEQQRPLGERQEELGREQARLARLAEAKFRVLLREAIRLGVVQRAD